jgi:hypothetical protein
MNFHEKATALCMNAFLRIRTSGSVQIRAEGSPNDGRWTVLHPGGSLSYHDNISIEGGNSAHRHRASIVLRSSLQQGIACFAYVLPSGHDASLVMPTASATLISTAPSNAIDSHATVSASGADIPTTASWNPAVPLPGGQQRLYPASTLPTNGIQDSGVSLGAMLGGPLLYTGEVPLAPITPPLLASTSALTCPNNVSAAAVSASMSSPTPWMCASSIQDAGKPVVPPKHTAEQFETYLMDDILDEDTACIACMARTREVIIIPCGHLVLCRQCSKGINTCPMCRVDICELISIG